MRTARAEVPVDLDAHPFATDVDKYVSIVYDGRRGPATRARMWLLDGDFRVVACFRFSQAVRAWRTDHPVLGLAPAFVAAVWRRRGATVHHFSIERGARIGPGLLVMHRNGVFIGPVSIGDNCVIHHNVTIGQRIAAGDHGVPRLGNDVWIGPGATITGDITIGDGATISAGAVVSRSVPDRALVAGNPGRVIQSDYDNSAMLNYTVRRPVPPPDAVDRAVEEYSRLRDPEGDRELEAVKAAIFLEDAFDVVLRDEDIDLDLLGTPEGMRSVLARRGRTA